MKRIERWEKKNRCTGFFLVILGVFIIIFGVVCSWFLSDNLYQTKGVLAYVTFCVSRLIDSGIKKDKRTNSVIENIFDVVENKNDKIRNAKSRKRRRSMNRLPIFS